jgi:hypothetical protein
MHGPLNVECQTSKQSSILCIFNKGLLRQHVSTSREHLQALCLYKEYKYTVAFNVSNIRDISCTLLCVLLVSLIIASNCLKYEIKVVILKYSVALTFRFALYLQKNIFYSVMCDIQAIRLFSGTVMVMIRARSQGSGCTAAIRLIVHPVF